MVLDIFIFFEGNAYLRNLTWLCHIGFC